jgi:hypothetical protein
MIPIKTRFAFVNGIWQLCMVVAALKQEQVNNPQQKYQDFLIVYTRSKGSFSNPELTQFVINASSQFWDWHGVAEIDWMPNEWSPEFKKNKQKTVQPLLEQFHINNISAIEEIWLCQIHFLHQRLFADIFYKSKLVLYEDGLHTYSNTPYLITLPKINLKQPISNLTEYKTFIRNYIQGNFDWVTQGIKRQHLRRVKKFYSVLGRKIAIPVPINMVPTELVDKQLLKTLFSELYNRLGCNFDLKLPSNNQKKIALFLGSNFSHMQSFPRELEVSVFTEAIQTIQEEYLILWKEHPRCKKPLFEDIKKNFNPGTIIYLSEEQKLPVEVMLSNQKIDLCCSTLSSSLFYLDDIYGIKTITCVQPLLPSLKGDFRQLAELTCAKIKVVV